MTTRRGARTIQSALVVWILLVQACCWLVVSSSLTHHPYDDSKLELTSEEESLTVIDDHLEEEFTSLLELIDQRQEEDYHDDNPLLQLPNYQDDSDDDDDDDEDDAIIFRGSRPQQRQQQRKLQQLNERCGGRRNLQCESNLQCTPVPLTGRRQICLPTSCLQEAWLAEIQEQNLENVAYDILQRAGFGFDPDVDDNSSDEEDSSTAVTRKRRAAVFNETSLQRGRLAMIRERGRYLLNEGVLDSLQQALLETPIDTERFQSRSAECTGQDALNATDPHQFGREELYIGFQVEASLGGKFVFQILVPCSDTGVLGTASYHFCFGGGPDVDFHLAFVFGGILSATAEDDLNQCSVMFDLDITAAAGIGWAVGYTTPDTCLTKVELTLNAGLGGGFGVTGCVVA